ncbi:unnamed protein product (macronuclear) [Paramecium tetraurelia]|uniref:Protein kinase domain-containing protein n=1 Tax=Paramecium tetraurelia TaxID=5888 RepID=A0C6Z3_PARTE|nr:uncharacterized protein GSPATT00035689001 [Paramecium tetraurelia]CAK66560.1 unnamed protein product [Paramecium tetraurelia]|eukprot:XP_001433957.1 hypothetical protein (macronuclear) [Paramecium tetraurelia strain d4-2]
MQQEIPLNVADQIIQDQMKELQQNFQLVEIAEGSQGICKKSEDRVYKFLNLKNNILTLDVLRGMNQNELYCLQELAISGYTCEVQNDKCDNQYMLWITTAYMNMGTLDMDCLYWENQHPHRLNLETITIICNRLLNILNYFHKNWIFHLDVQPSNILFHEEYQFCYSSENNDIELPIEQGLEQLRQNLGNNQQTSYMEQNITRDYTNLQCILNMQFQDLQPNGRRQLIERRFGNEHIDQLVFWINRWLKLQGMVNFNPQCIYVKKGIKICFCDFGYSQKIQEQELSRPEFEAEFFKTPYQILGKIVNPNEVIQAWRIARQQDLFCLGMTMINLLINNGHALIESIEFCQEKLVEFTKFLQDTYGEINLQKACTCDVQKFLLKLYSCLKWLQKYMNNNPTYYLIYRMLSFRFTSDIPLNIQRDQDIPLKTIREVQKLCNEMRVQTGL